MSTWMCWDARLHRRAKIDSPLLGPTRVSVELLCNYVPNCFGSPHPRLVALTDWITSENAAEIPVMPDLTNHTANSRASDLKCIEEKEAERGKQGSGRERERIRQFSKMERLVQHLQTGPPSRLFRVRGWDETLRAALISRTLCNVSSHKRARCLPTLTPLT